MNTSHKCSYKCFYCFKHFITAALLRLRNCKLLANTQQTHSSFRFLLSVFVPLSIHLTQILIHPHTCLLSLWHLLPLLSPLHTLTPTGKLTGDGIYHATPFNQSIDRFVPSDKPLTVIYLSFA